MVSELQDKARNGVGPLIEVTSGAVMTAFQLGWVMASDPELRVPDGVGLPDQELAGCISLELAMVLP